MNEATAIPQQFDIGGITIARVSGGINRADGGGMNGILPKVIWNRWYPADEKNRIELDTHCLVVDTGKEKILVETGCGNRLTDKERDFYGVDEGDWIGATLVAAGIPPESFDHVVVTHLHTDHVGGAVRRDGDGRLAPTFPNAKVWGSAQEYEDAESGYAISPNAYTPENYRPLADWGLLEDVASNGDITDGVRYVATPGHTRGHQSVLIEGRDLSVLFTGDALPLSRHATPHFNMAYDADPILKAKTKVELLERAYREEWILVLAHEPKTPVCRVVRNEEKGRFDLVEYAAG